MVQYGTFLHRRLTSCVFLIILGVSINSYAKVLWSDSGPIQVCNNGDGVDILRGACEAQDDSSSATMFFKFTVDPLTDITYDIKELYEAGLVLCDNGKERLGIGNGLAAHAYSAFNTEGQGLFWAPPSQKKGTGERDLNARFNESMAEMVDRPRRGIKRTFVYKIQFVPDGNDLVTVWIQPNLGVDNSESTQLPDQTTSFKANASFNEVRLIHRGGGEGWIFTDLAIATSFSDFVPVPWWQKPWVVGLILLLSLGSIGGVVALYERVRARRQIRSLEQERALEQERTRIARDLHDEVGAGLTALMLMCESLKQTEDTGSDTNRRLDDVLRSCSELADTMAEIIWAVNPDEDTVQNLVGYLSNFLQGFLETSSIRCRINIPSEIPDLKVSSKVRHNLFLAVKEAVNNSVKHATPSLIVLSADCSADKLYLEVTDDGCGFDVECANGQGNGLGNLRQRLEVIGGRIVIESSPGKGTVVRLIYSF